MKLALATLLLPAMASLPYGAARLGPKDMKIELNSLKPLEPHHKVHLAPVPTPKDTEEHRIIGGDVAESAEFPFFVTFTDEWGLICGGSLIHEDIILSAAHCSDYIQDEVIIGAYSLESPSEDEEIRYIETRRVHPNYDDFTSVNDVMVLKIDSPSFLATITLNNESASPSVGEDVVAIGLGISDDGDVSDVLRKVTVPTIAHDECAADYADFEVAVVEDVMLCAGLEEGGKDSCQGDSGGPLLELRDDKYVQVGITSWGDGCAEPNSPGVYTRVSGVKSWIDDMICELSENPPASCGSTPRPTPTTPPTSTTPSPPSNCEDSTEEFFVNRDCAWLGINQERYGFLCTLVDIALLCPVTCNICNRLPVL